MEMNSVFFSRCKKWFPYLLSGCLVVIGVALWLGKQAKKVEVESITAAKMWKKWSQSPENGEDGALSHLEDALARYPALASLYESKASQVLLSTHAPKQARVFTERALKRTKLHPYYERYARTSLALSEGNENEALRQSLELKEALLGDEAFLQRMQHHRALGSKLFAFNLLRIALLQKRLGNVKGEKEAWEAFEKYHESEEKDFKVGIDEVIAHLTLKEISLFDYIAMRKKALNP